jgi:hypothetical protein
MIDHITVTNDLIEDHIDGAERVENPSYIGSYISTTSDHAPVWTRFDFTRTLVSSEQQAEIPASVSLLQNYPNPFNPSTTLRFELDVPQQVNLFVTDLTGRRVAEVAEKEPFTSGLHEVPFDGSGLASGVYLYTLQTEKGIHQTKKMILIK